MIALKLILTAAIAYLLGCGNGSILVSKYILHDDIRQHGSGNAGLTNFYRVFGGKSTFLVILADVLKALISVWVGAMLLGSCVNIPMFGRLWGATFCMVGHDFPFMFGFKGGKGVLSGGAIAIAIDWRVGLLCWGLFIVIVVCTRYVSAGSIAAGAAFPLGMFIWNGNPVMILIGAFCGGLLIWGHRGNIRRLLKGEESKFYFHKKGAARK